MESHCIHSAHPLSTPSRDHASPHANFPLTAPPPCYTRYCKTCVVRNHPPVSWSFYPFISYGRVRPKLSCSVASPSLALPSHMPGISSLALNPQGRGIPQSARQTRRNPSRTSKTTCRSFFASSRGSIAEIPPTPLGPPGFYPALTHFTDAIAALPRELCQHNSLLKEVDAKAWALEENLHQLLKHSSESQPVLHPFDPAPIMGGVLPKVGRFHRQTSFWRTLLLMASSLTPGTLSVFGVAREYKPATPFRSRATESVRPHGDGR